jgi:hypothetical protein
VAVVEIRAYPRGGLGAEFSRPEGGGSKPAGLPTAQHHGWASAFQWLTTPLEGYTAAKKTAMISLNDKLLADALSATDRSFIFESSADVPLSWSLAPRGRDQLDGIIASDAFQNHLNELVQFLTGAPSKEEKMQQKIDEQLGRGNR